MGEQKIRVLEAFGEPISYGGQEAFVKSIYQFIDRNTFQIDCLTPYFCDNPMFEELFQRHNSRIFTLQLPFKTGDNRFLLRKDLAQFFREHSDYDILHVHSGSLTTLCAYAEVAKKCGIKRVIVHSHSGGIQESFFHKAMKIVLDFRLRRFADGFLACSKEAAEWKYCEKLRGQAVILRNGIDTKQFRFDPQIREEVRKEFNLERKFVLGNVGRFCYQKNQEYLIQIIHKLKIIDPNVMLILVGNGETFAEIKSRVREQGLTNYVIFLGNRNDIYRIYQAMDVFLLPSRFEGLPIVGIEAEAAGLPIVMSDNISKEFICTENVEALSILPEAVNDWVGVIEKLKTRERDRNAWEKVKNGSYDIGNTAKELEQIYKNVLDGIIK